jgi:hypothetical protein
MAGEGRQDYACWGFGKEWDWMVNVRDFGALGNGTHDDTPNIQAAIDNTALSGLPDKGVYFPAGDYLINSADPDLPPFFVPDVMRV